jgi:hypothetical protein
MDPNVWGKHMWASIHFIALAYPDAPTEENKNTYYSFFTNLYKVLPCHKCREHLNYTPTFLKTKMNCLNGHLTYTTLSIND